MKDKATVWKYNLDPRNGGKDTFKIPLQAEICSVGPDPSDQHLVAIWLRVVPPETESQMAERTFYLIGTGHPANFDDTFIGTVVQPPFAWHVFMEMPETLRMIRDQALRQNLRLPEGAFAPGEPSRA